MKSISNSLSNNKTHTSDTKLDWQNGTLQPMQTTSTWNNAMQTERQLGKTLNSLDGKQVQVLKSLAIYKLQTLGSSNIILAKYHDGLFYIDRKGK